MEQLVICRPCLGVTWLNMSLNDYKAIMIKLEGITKSFGSLQVLKGIDLEINKGEIVSIVGPSGAGKLRYCR